jgi:hypothetical protein
LADPPGARLARKEEFMNAISTLPPHLPAQVLWLQVQMSERLDVAGVERWRKRLQAYLSTHGLVAAIAPERIAVLPICRSLTLLDRGLVIGWLIAQPEVVFVHIERCTPAPRIEVAGPNKDLFHG